METIDALLQQLLEPPGALMQPSEFIEVDDHELIRLERTGQAAAYEALTAGAEPARLREPAREVGQQIATWTSQLLRRLAEER